MREAKGWCFCYALIVVCLVGALTGCSHDPDVRKRMYLESGERFYDKGQYREAAIQFQNAIQVDARFAEAHYKLAQTAIKLQQWPGALQEFENATQINPEYNEARLEYAKLFITLGDYADAKAQLDVLAQKQPNNPDAYLALADYYNLNAATRNSGAALGALQK